MRRTSGRHSGYISFLFTGALAGALTFVGLWLCCLLMASGFSVMGVQAAPIAKMVFKQFLLQVIWIQLRILLVYVVIGAMIGLAGAVVLLGFTGKSRTVPSRWWALGMAVIFGLLVESLSLLWAIRRTPQLFADFFYLPGGWTRQVMVMITDRLPWWIAPYALGGFLAICILAAVVLLWKRVAIGRQWRGWSGSGAVFLLGAIIVAGIAVSGSRHRSNGQELPAPGIVILGADSFRSDHISGLGYHRPTSPNIDSLISRGTVFTNAITPLPRTFPAWVSYLTGTYPRTHGIRHMFPTDSDREHIPDAVPKILGESGWHSGIISDFAGDVFSRINLGFRTVHAPEFTFITLIKLRSLEIHWALMPYVNTGLGRRVFPVLSEFAQAGYPQYLGTEARHYLKQRARRQEPFFLTVFFSATHFPYSAPDPFYHLFTDPNYAGDYKYHKPNLLKSHEDLTPDDITQIVALYDGTVRAIDEEIGKILATLDETGLSRNTWIIITGDHGENLYEGEMGMGHGEHLRGHNVLRIPLIIVPPTGYEMVAERVEVPVSGIDIAPTLLNLAGKQSRSYMEGWSLMPLIEGNEDVVQKFRDRPVFAETGLWFANWTEGFYQHQRIQYPDVSKLCRLDPFHGFQMVLKDEVRDLMEVAKHRMALQDSVKLILIPARDGVSEEAYHITSDGSEVSANPSNPEFQSLRNALYQELTTDRRFDRFGDFVVPEGWFWRLNRRVAMER